MERRKCFEADGTHKGQTVYCPVNGWDCPYCDKNNVCHVADPMEDCDDFAACFDSWEDWESL